MADIPLFEQYRPKSFDEVCGQDQAVQQLAFLRKRGLGGRGYWLAGLTGTGKSSIGYLIAAEIAGEFGTDEVDASTLTPKDILDWRRKVSRRCLGEPSGWALIVNEAHGLRKDTVKTLMNMLDGGERIPSYAVMIFTTTEKGEAQLFDGCIDAHPLMSRMQVVPLQSAGEQLTLGFALRCRQIAQTEGLDGKDLSEYVSLVRREKYNLRSCLQKIEAGEMMKA